MPSNVMFTYDTASFDILSLDIFRRSCLPRMRRSPGGMDARTRLERTTGDLRVHERPLRSARRKLEEEEAR